MTLSLAHLGSTVPSDVFAAGDVSAETFLAKSVESRPPA